MLSVYVVCWIFLQTFQTYFCIQAIFLQTFQTYFCIQANSVDPDQSDLGPHCLQKWLLNHKQMTKQTTIVVIGSLRVKRSQTSKHTVDTWDPTLSQRWKERTQTSLRSHAVITLDYEIREIPT